MRKWLTIGIICGLIALFSTTANSETLYLKSGEKVTGKIVGQSANSVMIQEDGGGYKSYSTEAIKEIKKEGVAEAPPAKVTIPQDVAGNENKKSKIFYPFQNSYLLKTKAGATFKISLPIEWKMVRLGDIGDDGTQDGIAVFMIGDLLLNPITSVSFNGLYAKGFSKHSTNDAKKAFLIDLRNKTLEKDKAENRKWISEEYSEFHGFPSFVVTYQESEAKIYKTNTFIMGSEVYFIRFLANSNSEFDKQWPIVEQSLKNMEIQEASQ